MCVVMRKEGKEEGIEVGFIFDVAILKVTVCMTR